ncbi:hypothetical protein [Thalassovita sp.]|uniref:hypothetical protein n=1 Tax=Thalassovita sp. TaxID=1979401 RepID=UPI0029DE6078|nr:hypothetical protein [Thalassovita sp.]
MLEIHETLKTQQDWEDSGLFSAMDDLMQWARVDEQGLDDTWPGGRIVCAECVVMDDGEPVGMGRVIWDSHLEDSLPVVTHLCLTPAHRTDFVLGTLESVLVDAYAADPIGGDLLRVSNGCEVDLAERARAYLSALLGQADPRMI